MNLYDLLTTPPADLDPTAVETYLAQARTRLQNTIDVPVVIEDNTAQPHQVRLVLNDDPTYPHYRLPDPATFTVVALRELSVDPYAVTARPPADATTDDQALAAEVQQALREAWARMPLVDVRRRLRHYAAAGSAHRMLLEARKTAPAQVAGARERRLRVELMELAATAPHITADQAELADTLMADWVGTPVELLDAVTAATTTVAP